MDLNNNLINNIMKSLFFLLILAACVVTAFPFWLLVFEHIFRGRDSILQLLLDGIEYKRKVIKEELTSVTG